MIDHTTLPFVPANTTLTVGQRFTVVGSGFQAWPDELVLSYRDAVAQTEPMPSYNLMRLVSKTDTELVFDVLVEHEFAADHEWSSFCAGLNPPREMLAYERM